MEESALSSSTGGIPVFPIISLVIFVVFFLIVLVLMAKADKNLMKKMSSLPLDDDSNKINNLE